MKRMPNSVQLELMSLELDRDSILHKCACWKRCQDGSYEMALHHAGFNSVVKKIAEIKEKYQ